MLPNHQFCFDLSLDEKLGFFIPTVYIIYNSDKIDYVDKKATPTIIKSFGINSDDLNDNYQRLLAIIELLKPEVLFKKFEKNPKSKKTIYDLLLDRTFGKIIQSYIDNKLNQFLEIVNDNKLWLRAFAIFELSF